MIRFFILFLLPIAIFASEVERFRWINGETYLVFLENNNLPVRKLYYKLDTYDQRLTEEMRAGAHCQILKDSNGKIEQALLPLNDELQVHIYKKNDSYTFEAIPIISTTKTESFTNGKISAEELYKKAIKGNKKYRTTRKRRQ